jgi:hypothetical protein
MNVKLKIAGAALVAGALALVIAAYAGKPDVPTCQVINSVSVQLGNPATCSASPSAVLMWLALGLGIAGFAVLALGRHRA